MTKLRDLNAKMDGGVLCFDCPMGHPHSICVPIACAEYKGWSATGEFPDTLSLTPSILAHTGHPHDADLTGDAHESASRCGWHGFVKNGDVT